MSGLKKKRLLTTLKYTWPFYIVTALLIALLMNFIFSFAHRLPSYQTLTIFISGEITEPKKLKEELLDKYEEKELKSVTLISSKINDSSYQTKLSVTGYNSSDLLIIPLSICDNINVSSFSLELADELINKYYSMYHFYKQGDEQYGIKLNNAAISKYVALPNEDCYLFLNGKSENLGEYSTKGNSQHNIVLNLAKEWGM